MKWMNFKVAGFLILITQIGYAQNLFDFKNSRAFADYLFATGRYDQAVNEYQRVLFMKPLDTASWLNLVKSNQFSRAYHDAIHVIDSAEARVGYGLLSFGKARAYSYLKTREFDQIKSMFQAYPFHEEEVEFISSSTYALQGQWKYFQENSNSLKRKDFYEMSQEVLQHKHKSPVLAGLMSTVVPGTGKIYTGRWKDGLFSMLLFGTSAWQAYRLVSKNGVDNFGSLFFGGMAIGFYTGNVYGSVKSAKDYNDALDKQFRERTDLMVDQYFGF